jgi:hypothetical protein
MYLQNWMVKKVEELYKYAKFNLKMNATCSVPGCEKRIKIFEIKESFRIFMESRNKKYVKNKILEQIKKPRPCPGCGVISTFSQSDLEKIEKELPRKLENN